MSEDIREEISAALRKRAEWPSLHWPSLDALQHADVTRALADALMPLVARIRADAFDEGWIERASRDIAFKRGRTAASPPTHLNPYRADRLEQGDPS